MMLARRTFLLATLLMLCPPAVMAQSPAGLSAEVQGQVERAISTEMARQQIPGLSVAVMTDGVARWSSGYGFADLENFVPVTAGTMFRTASISKPMTAVAAMQLAEKGKLDLDAPVQKYVPQFPEKPWPVTTRQLLAHLGGIRWYQGDEAFSTRHYANRENLLEPLEMFKDDPLLAEPGTLYRYSTYGYNLAGNVVEGASGMHFMEYLRRHVLEPAGMKHTRDDHAYELIPRRAQGYRKTADGKLLNSRLADTSNKIPGGGLLSTAEDLVRFAAAVQSGKLVGDASREAMFTRQRLKNGELTTYGLGWAIAEHKGIREISHGGGQSRVSTLLYTRPDSRCAVALMTNLEGAKLMELAREIADLVTSPGAMRSSR